MIPVIASLPSFLASPNVLCRVRQYLDYHLGDGAIPPSRERERRVNYSELLAEIAEMPQEKRKTMNKLAQVVGLGGDVSERYACVLDAASSCDEFFDLLYNHSAARSDYAWAVIARALHPDWLDCFEPRQVERAVELTDGCLVLESAQDGKADLPIPLPATAGPVDVLLFDDGQVNESALFTLGVSQGAYRVGSIEFDGQFSVSIDGNHVVIISWIIGEDGFRISEKSKIRIS